MLSIVKHTQNAISKLWNDYFPKNVSNKQFAHERKQTINALRRNPTSFTTNLTKMYKKVKQIIKRELHALKQRTTEVIANRKKVISAAFITSFLWMIQYQNILDHRVRTTKTSFIVYKNFNVVLKTWTKRNSTHALLKCFCVLTQKETPGWW